MAVIRGLAEAGVAPVGVAFGSKQVAMASRHLREVRVAPDPNDDEAAFVAWLLDQRSDLGGVVLITTDDASLMAVSRAHESLAQAYRLAAQPWAVVGPLLEKSRTYAIAEAAGIPAPRTVVAGDTAQAREFAAKVGFPCLLEPSVGHAFLNRFKAKMRLVRDQDELRRVLGELAGYPGEIMLSEFIPGDDTGTNDNALWDRGRPLREFTARKLRQRPTSIGFPTVVESRWMPDVALAGRRVIETVGLAGISCTEFKRDARDGVLKLMEVNARHNLSGGLAVACGVNFPLLSYRHALGDPLEPDDSRQIEGVRWIDEPRDLLGLPQAARGGFRALASFFRPYRGPYVSAVFSLDDPRPGLRFIAEQLGLVRGGSASGRAASLSKAGTP